MSITGIICEYNPLHLGHSKQIRIIKNCLAPDDGIVCLMSGNYVQRGTPAIFDKMLRAEAAVRCGADLVVELPVTVSLSSAEGFAAGGVNILSSFCDKLCFGAETADTDKLLSTAQALLAPALSDALHMHLSKGLSFPAARQAALETMGIDGSILSTPNNILAVEYCKAIIVQKASLHILPIQRMGSYHDTTANMENPSATAVRKCIIKEGLWRQLIPQPALPCFENAKIHTLLAGERAILGRLRFMNEDDFSVLPYGSEGLWRKLMYAARSKPSIEDIATAVKSKRYTRSRIDRMIMCAFLGITEQMLQTPPPYIRVLAFNEKGRGILKQARLSNNLPNIGQAMDHSYQQHESKWDDLYGMFAVGKPDPANIQKYYRVYNHQP